MFVILAPAHPDVSINPFVNLWNQVSYVWVSIP